MNYDNETVREALGAFTFTERGIFEPPDPVQVATLAAILETEDRPAIACVEDAVLLIAKTKSVLKEIRAAAAQPGVDFGVTVSVQEAAKETGVSVRTIESYARDRTIKIENGRINKLHLASITKIRREKKTTRAKLGFKKSHFKARKRHAS